MSNYARNILGLDKNEDDVSLVSKEDGMSYIRDLNRVIHNNDLTIEARNALCQLNSIGINNEAVINDTILENERLNLIKDLMVSENGISLEDATDIMNSYISESGKIDFTKMLNKVKMLWKKIVDFISKKMTELSIFIQVTQQAKHEAKVFFSKNKDIKLKDVIGGEVELGKIISLDPSKPDLGLYAWDKDKDILEMFKYYTEKLPDVSEQQTGLLDVKGAWRVRKCKKLLEKAKAKYESMKNNRDDSNMSVSQFMDKYYVCFDKKFIKNEINNFRTSAKTIDRQVEKISKLIWVGDITPIHISLLNFIKTIETNQARELGLIMKYYNKVVIYSNKYKKD